MNMVCEWLELEWLWLFSRNGSGIAESAGNRQTHAQGEQEQAVWAGVDTSGAVYHASGLATF